jgi:RsiW-degrading membrane proteinase PrsW (M82 family)
MGLFLSIFFGFVPMFFFAWFVYWLDRYEKEPKVLLGLVFFWGAIVAAGGAFLINTLLGLGVYMFTGSEGATELTTGSLIAPIVEESLKGFAILIVFFLFRREFDSWLDGVIYAAIVALGFAATENAYYIFQYGYQENGISGLLWLVFVRVVLVGWQHPFYTAFIGLGLAASRLSRSPGVRLLSPVLGWLIAVFAHSFHNTLAELSQGFSGLVFGTVLDWGGWLLMFSFIIWVIFREQRAIAINLLEEVALGVLTEAQYQTACSALAMNGARFNALTRGHYRQTNRFYQACAELAHKKQQRASLGEETGNTVIIEHLRGELSRLRPFVA